MMSTSRDEELITGCLNNNREAQKALYDRYKNKMYTLAYRITNNFDDANDVLQDGFILVFENLKSFKGKSGLGTWIHTIIARTSLKKIRDRIHFADISEADETGEINWAPDIDLKVLEKAIASLPDGYRSIFTLYEIEEYKHKEIAEMMNISVNTSKSQLYKAKKMLQEKLKENRF